MANEPATRVSGKSTKIGEIHRSLVYEKFEIDPRIRQQLLNALKRSVNGKRKLGPYYVPSFNPADVWYLIYDLVSEEIGLPFGSVRYSEDLFDRFVSDHGDAHQVLTALQIAIAFVCENQSRLKHFDHHFPPQYDCDQLIAKTNSVLRQGRVEYQFVEGAFLATGSDFMYTDVIEPAFLLLSDASFRTASEEFRAAWEKNRDDPNDKTALSLANGALETTMKHILKERGASYREGVDSSRALIVAIMETGVLKPWQDEHVRELTNLLAMGSPRVRNKESSHGPEPDGLPPAPHLIRYGINLAAATIVMLVEAHKAAPKTPPSCA